MPPDTATRIRSDGSSMSYAEIARLDLPADVPKEALAQKAALWRRISTTAGALQRRHFIRFSLRAPPLITGRSDDVGLTHAVLARQQLRSRITSTCRG